MLQLYRFFRDEKGLEQTDIYYQAHVLIGEVVKPRHNLFSGTRRINKPS